MCSKQILQSSDIRVHLNSCYVTLIVITLFRGLSGITGKASRSLSGIGKTAEECFISLNTNLIQEPFVVFLYCIVLVLFYLVTTGISAAAARKRAGGKSCLSFHITQDGSPCCFELSHPKEPSIHVR